MPYKDPNYRKNYYQRPEVKVRKKAYDKEYRKTHKKECKGYERKYAQSAKGRATISRASYLRRIKRKAQIEKILGNKCLVCGNNTRKIHYHEIHGKPHTYNGVYIYAYIIKHLEDFIPLCCRCHNVVHYLLNLGEKREEILKLLNQMINENVGST
jgi:hypothetical protein